MSTPEDFDAYLDAWGEDVTFGVETRRAIVDRDHAMVNGPDGVFSINQPSIQGKLEDWQDLERGDTLEVPFYPNATQVVTYRVHQLQPDGLGWFVALLVRLPA